MLDLRVKHIGQSKIKSITHPNSFLKLVAVSNVLLVRPPIILLSGCRSLPERTAIIPMSKILEKKFSNRRKEKEKDYMETEAGVYQK